MSYLSPAFRRLRSLLSRRAILISVLPIQVWAMEFYVAPDGSDGWSGRLARPNSDRSDGPLASLQGARDTVRRTDHSREAVTVIVAEGRYPLRTPVEFFPQDSGSEGHPVTYRAGPGARPVFEGGRVITGWRKDGDNRWSTEIADVAAGRWRFEQLWVNGRRAVRAREPNRGFLSVASVSETPASPSDSTGAGAPEGWTHQTIGLTDDDVSRLARVGDGDLPSVQIVAYHYWETTRRFLDKWDPRTGVLSFSARPKHPYAGIRSGTRYHLENALAFLDEPGEWFLDRGGKLYYFPRPGENMATAEVVAPELTQFLLFEGDAARGSLVEHLRFEGLTFRFGQWLTPPDGISPQQSATTTSAAIVADGLHDSAFVDCEISHVGEHALWLRRACRAVSIRGCLIEDLGSGGVRVGEEAADRDATQQTAGIELDNNVICDGGHIVASGVGIWLGCTSDNRVTHNDVSQFYSTGISVGWQWGYGETTAARNCIEFNRVHHLGWGLLSDLGGIYFLGVSPGTECRRNVISRIAGADYGGWGIYLDEGSSYIHVADNLVYGTTHGGFHQHYGRENLVENNIFALGRDAQLQVTRSEPHLSLTFNRNIVYWNHGELGARLWGEATIAADYNLYFRSGTFGDAFRLERLRAGTPVARDAHSLVQDPGFRDPSRGDFTLEAKSPARELGFVPFAYEEAGVYGPSEWRAQAARAAQPVSPSWLEQNPFESPAQ